MAGNEAAGANFKGWQAIFNSFTVAGRRNVSPKWVQECLHLPTDKPFKMW